MNHQDRITDLQGRIASLDWDRIARDLDSTGYALVPKLLDQVECERLAVGYDSPGAFRKTVVMARYRFGMGEYKYWTYPLPEIVQTLRQQRYVPPSPNAWASF